MNIFHTLNKEVEKPDFTLKIKNIEVSRDHWGSEREILNFCQKIENVVHLNAGEALGRNELFSLYIDLFKANPRMQAVRFFGNKDILVSDIRTFEPENYLKRGIEMYFPKYDLKWELFEITSKEVEEKVFPEDWKEDDVLTKQFDRYKQLFIQ